MLRKSWWYQDRYISRTQLHSTTNNSPRCPRCMPAAKWCSHHCWWWEIGDLYQREKSNLQLIKEFFYQILQKVLLFVEMCSNLNQSKQTPDIPQLKHFYYLETVQFTALLERFSSECRKTNYLSIRLLGQSQTLVKPIPSILNWKSLCKSLKPSHFKSGSWVSICMTMKWR